MQEFRELESFNSELERIMSKEIDRRKFLKVMAIAGAAYATKELVAPAEAIAGKYIPNDEIIIILFWAHKFGYIDLTDKYVIGTGQIIKGTLENYKITPNSIEGTGQIIKGTLSKRKFQKRTLLGTGQIIKGTLENYKITPNSIEGTGQIIKGTLSKRKFQKRTLQGTGQKIKGTFEKYIIMPISEYEKNPEKYS